MPIYVLDSLSQCIRTVFKIRSSNFSYRSRTFRSRSWRGWRFYGTPWGSENCRVITHRKRNSHLIVNNMIKVLSHRDSRFSLSLKKTLIRHAFAQFSRYRVETLQVRQLLTGTGRGGVGDSTFPRYAQKKRVNHSKNVNSTYVRTVFKIQSWNFTGTSMSHRDRSWRGWCFYGTPWGSEMEG